MPVTEAVTPAASTETRTLERLVDVLQRELDAARERETMLLQMLSQMQQQNQRLLDMPRTPPPPLSGPGTPALASAPRGDMRRRIVALLQEHPEGLSPVQTRQLLGVAKDLGSTMKAMARDGLLRRVETGRYGVGA